MEAQLQLMRSDYPKPVVAAEQDSEAESIQQALLSAGLIWSQTIARDQIVYHLTPAGLAIDLQHNETLCKLQEVFDANRKLCIELVALKESVRSTESAITATTGAPTTGDGKETIDPGRRMKEHNTAQSLMGRLAEMERVTVRDLYERYGVDVDE